MKEAVPESDEWRKPHAKKDKKRYCGGNPKRGEHQPVIRRRTDIGSGRPCQPPYEWQLRARYWRTRTWNCFHHKVCSNCGKILEHWLEDTNECPDRANWKTT